MNFPDLNVVFVIIGFFSTIWIITFAIAHGITLGIGRAKQKLTKENK